MSAPDPMDAMTYVEDGPRTLVSCGCWWDITGGLFLFHAHDRDCPVTGYVLQAAEQMGMPMAVVE